MKVEICPFDSSDGGPFSGVEGETVPLPLDVLGQDPLPRAGEHLIWQGRHYVVDYVTHDHDRGVIVLIARRSAVCP